MEQEITAQLLQKFVTSERSQKTLSLAGNQLIKLGFRRRLNDEDLEEIRHFLQKHPDIKSLNLAYNNLSRVDTLFQHSENGIENLNLMYNDCTDSEIVSLMAQLTSEGVHIKSLNLRGLKLGLEGFKAIGKYITTIGSSNSDFPLSNLNLSETDTDLMGLGYILKGLKSRENSDLKSKPQIVQLYQKHMNKENVNMPSILSPSLYSLDWTVGALDDKNIDDESCSISSSSNSSDEDGFETGIPLNKIENSEGESLDFEDYKNIESGALLAEGKKDSELASKLFMMQEGRNRKLEEMNSVSFELSLNRPILKYPEEVKIGASVLGKYVKDAKYLQTLHIQKWGLRDEGLHELMTDGLLLNTTLVTLDLSSNSIGPVGAKLLGQYLSSNFNLKELFLNFNGIKDDGLMHICDHFAQGKTNISVLSLQFNQLTSISLDRLLQLIPSTKIQKICLLGGLFGNETYILMKNLLEKGILVDTDIQI